MWVAFTSGPGNMSYPWFYSNQLHFFVSGPFVLIQLTQTLNAYPTRVRQCDTSIALDFAQVLK